MLLGQQRGGREHRHLAAGTGSHVGRTQRHFRLAEAHVAADQPVHGFGGDQVLHDGMDGGLLVGGFLEAEALGKGGIAGRLELEGMAGAGGAAGVEIEQFHRRVTCLFGGLATGLVPLAGTQRVQGGIFGGGTGIAADEVQHGHRHVQRGIAGIGEVQEFGGAVAQIDVDQPHVAANAVLCMHDRVARFQFGEITDEGVDLGGLALAALVLPDEGGKQLAFGDDQQLAIGQAEAALQRADGQHHGGIGGHGRGPVFGRGHFQARFGKEFLQGFTPAQRFGDDQAFFRGSGDEGGRIEHVAQGADRIVLAAVDGHVRHGEGVEGTGATQCRRHMGCGGAVWRR